MRSANKLSARFAGALFCIAVNAASAAPVAYEVPTGPALAVGNDPTLAGMFSGSTVSGAFTYDSASPLAGVNADGSFRYGPNPPASSFANLSGIVSGGAISPGRGFSDPFGFTIVGNNTFVFPAATCPGCPPTDMFQLFAESSLASGTHNIVPFTIGGFTLFNVRMFWIEGQSTPELIPPLFDNQALPGAPPGIHGRLVLDFVTTGNPGGPQSNVFFDGLTVRQVPEPPTYALAAGFALLALAMRRSKGKLLAAQG